MITEAGVGCPGGARPGYAGCVLRVKPARPGPLRILDDRDRGEVLRICDADPVTNVFVGARVHAVGLNPARLGAQIWGHYTGGRLTPPAGRVRSVITQAGVRCPGGVQPGYA